MIGLLTSFGMGCERGIRKKKVAQRKREMGLMIHHPIKRRKKI